MMRQILALSVFAVLAPAAYSQPPNAILSAKDASTLFQRSLQLIESTSAAVPGLVRAGLDVFRPHRRQPDLPPAETQKGNQAAHPRRHARRAPAGGRGQAAKLGDAPASHAAKHAAQVADDMVIEPEPQHESGQHGGERHAREPRQQFGRTAHVRANPRAQDPQRTQAGDRAARDARQPEPQPQADVWLGLTKTNCVESLSAL